MISSHDFFSFSMLVNQFSEAWVNKELCMKGKLTRRRRCHLTWPIKVV
jgi:hypothetical protein